MNFHVFEQGFTYVDQEQQIHFYSQKKEVLCSYFIGSLGPCLSLFPDCHYCYLNSAIHLHEFQNPTLRKFEQDCITMENPFLFNDLIL
jgi:hypothetical protein